MRAKAWAVAPSLACRSRLCYHYSAWCIILPCYKPRSGIFYLIDLPFSLSPVLLLYFHRLAATDNSSISGTGDDEFWTTLRANIPFAYLVCHFRCLLLLFIKPNLILSICHPIVNALSSCSTSLGRYARIWLYHVKARKWQNERLRHRYHPLQKYRVQMGWANLCYGDY